jgi:uncharacterized repeat protein (TIGR03803 family)
MLRTAFQGFALMLVVAPPAANAQPASETVLYSFCSQANCTDGANPESKLIFDASGNLIGTTILGGVVDGCYGNGCGTVFKLAPDGTESVLHAFTGAVGDGALPFGGLVPGQFGSFYGTTQENGEIGYFGNGTVYEVAADGTETVLHYFDSERRGWNPTGELTQTNKHNFYGSTVSGGYKRSPCGSMGCGTVFNVHANGRFNLLYRFSGGTDGGEPDGGVIVDNTGTLYVTTSIRGNTGCSGYAFGCGSIDKIAPDGTLTVLHTFLGGSDGAVPEGELIADGDGNFYGTTVAGGDCKASLNGCGTVYEFTGSGNETVLYSFKAGSDGAFPYTGVVRDKRGHSYGVTASGGNTGCGGGGCGTVFEISPSGKEKILYTFTGGDDGANPYAGLLMGPHGALYGTTEFGGAYGSGTVFRIQKDQ